MTEITLKQALNRNQTTDGEFRFVLMWSAMMAMLLLICAYLLALPKKERPQEHWLITSEG